LGDLVTATGEIGYVADLRFERSTFLESPQNNAEDPPPEPESSQLTDFFWSAAREHRLEILRCRDCGNYVHLPRELCSVCRSFDLRPVHVSGQAVLYSWTICEQAIHPWFARRVPYVLAAVELVEQRQLRMLTNVVDCAESDLTVGLRLQVDFLDLAPAHALPVFHPVTAEG
jgi:uncharacterized protein